MYTDAPYIFRFGEKIYIGNADTIFASLAPAFEPSAPRLIACDMSAVQVCDSYGLRLLLSLQRKAQETDKKLVLCRLTALLSDVLNAVNLTKIFDIREDLPIHGTDAAKECGRPSA